MMSANAESRSLIARLRFPLKGASTEQVRIAIAALKHRNGFVRSVALECLGSLRPPNLQQILVEGLSDRSWEVRFAALEALENVPMSRRRLPSQLLRLLNDSSMLVRVQTAEVLGTSGNRTALPQLRRALRDRSPLVRRYVAEAIGRLGSAYDR